MGKPTGSWRHLALLESIHRSTGNTQQVSYLLTLLSLSAAREIPASQTTWQQEGSNNKSMFIKDIKLCELENTEIRLRMYIRITHHSHTTQVLLHFLPAGWISRLPWWNFHTSSFFWTSSRKKNKEGRNKEETAKCQEDPQSKQQFSSSGKKTAFCYWTL